MLGDLGKLIVAKGFKNLPKVQKIARSGHTGSEIHFSGRLLACFLLRCCWFFGKNIFLSILPLFFFCCFLNDNERPVAPSTDDRRN